MVFIEHPPCSKHVLATKEYKAKLNTHFTHSFIQQRDTSASSKAGTVLTLRPSRDKAVAPQGASLVPGPLSRSTSESPGSFFKVQIPTALRDSDLVVGRITVSI